MEVPQMDPVISDEQRDDRLDQKARDTLIRCGNCAQTSFAVLQEEFSLEGGPILRALTPFPGVALRGETCGAVIGSLMAIGMVYGRDSLDDWRGYIGSLPPARRFCREFEKQQGSTMCEAIVEAKLGRKYNLADPAEALEYASSGGPEACGKVVASAVLIAAEVIRKKASPTSPLAE
jgi:C_GCAxxG_C_C family probable redox protein